MGDHRAAGFPDVAGLLCEALGAVQVRHPEGLDHSRIALQERYFSFWTYPRGSYEIDDDIWGLFVQARADNRAVTADVERALLATRLFVKEDVDFAQYR